MDETAHNEYGSNELYDSPSTGIGTAEFKIYDLSLEKELDNAVLRIKIRWFCYGLGTATAAFVAFLLLNH